MTMLLNNEATVNTKGYDGRTPLMLSAASGSEQMISMLLAKGAKINAINNDGDSVLDAAFNKIEGD